MTYAQVYVRVELHLGGGGVWRTLTLGLVAC